MPIMSEISDLVTSIGVLFIVFQCYLLRKQIKDDHERSRRQLTMQVMREWALSLDRETRVCVEFVNKLDFDCCDRIDRGESFSIKDPSLAKECATCLSTFYNEQIALENKEDSFIVRPVDAVHIRYSITRYLNMLETALFGWKEGITSVKNMEEEFSFLYDNKKSAFLLNEYRKAAGEEHYPAISAFCEQLKRKNYIAAKISAPLG